MCMCFFVCINVHALATHVQKTHKAIAVFMPCFMSQQPAGMQIYLCTSFLFTLGQGAALRTNSIREFLGLPKLGGPPQEGDLAKEFMQLKKLERKAQELRGNGPLLGRGVLAAGLECSFAGSNRPSTIIGSNPEGGPDVELVEMLQDYTTAMRGTSDGKVHARVEQEEEEEKNHADLYNGPFIHGISAPYEEMMERKLSTHDDEDEYISEISDNVMEAANRGERPVIMAPVDPIDTTSRKKLDARTLLKKRGKKRGKPRKK